MKAWVLMPLAALLLGGCVKDKTQPKAEAAIQNGSIRITEFISKACSSTVPPTLCVPTNYTPTVSFNGKWFELYNTTNDPIVLEAGKWYFTDTLGTPNKWAVSSNTDTIPAKGYTYVCADNLNEFSGGHWHTSFSLSSAGGDIGVFYNADTSNHDVSTYVRVAAITYPLNVQNYNSNTRNQSYGVFPGDTTNSFQPLSQPTPGAANIR